VVKQVVSVPAETPEEAVAVARELLGMQIRGYDVKEVLVEEQLQLEQEFLYGCKPLITGREKEFLCSVLPEGWKLRR
jgi:succinyl-CoA synthetase beta subunit